MTLEKLQTEMIQALKDGNKYRKQVISGLVDAVKKAGIDAGCRDNIPATLVDQVMMKCKKIAKEQYDTCPDSYADLKAEFAEQIKIVDEFAPSVLSDEELIRKEINVLLRNENIEPLKKNMGLIMKSVKAHYCSTIDMAIVSKIIKEILA